MKTASESGTVVKRAPDFAELGEYIVTLKNGRAFRIYRDTDQFSYPVWYCVGHDALRSFKKVELVGRLEAEFSAH